MFRSGHSWTDADRAYGDAAHDREQALKAAAVRLLKEARRHKAKTPAGVYAKALLVRGSITGAALLSQTLADDLIACDGLRRCLTWPEAQT